MPHNPAPTLLLLLCAATAVTMASSSGSGGVAFLWPPSACSSGTFLSGTPLLLQLQLGNGTTLPTTATCAFCTARWGQDNGTTCVDSLSSLSSCTAVHWLSASTTPLPDYFFRIITSAGAVFTSCTFGTVAHTPLAGQFCAAAYRLYIAAFVFAIGAAVLGFAGLPLMACYRPKCCARSGVAAKQMTARLVAFHAARSGANAAVHGSGNEHDTADTARRNTTERHPLLGGAGCCSRTMAHVAVAPATMLSVEMSSWIIIFSVGSVIATCIAAFVNANSVDVGAISCTQQQAAAAGSLIVALSAFIGACFKVSLEGLGMGMGMGNSGA